MHWVSDEHTAMADTYGTYGTTPSGNALMRLTSFDSSQFGVRAQ